MQVSFTNFRQNINSKKHWQFKTWKKVVCFRSRHRKKNKNVHAFFFLLTGACPLRFLFLPAWPRCLLADHGPVSPYPHTCPIVWIKIHTKTRCQFFIVSWETLFLDTAVIRKYESLVHAFVRPNTLKPLENWIVNNSVFIIFPN